MNRDISVVVPRLVLLLRDSDSYKVFLASSETEAQRLLDLLQDVSASLFTQRLVLTEHKQLLDLDSFSVVKPLISKALLRISRESGLHPRCCALSDCKKLANKLRVVGLEISGGLGSWTRCLRQIMRIFEDSDVQVVLKEFGREALIWRQMCHPNVLPFFGLYYLGKGCVLCPVDGKGHIMKFLTNKNPTNTVRLSLVRAYSDQKLLLNHPWRFWTSPWRYNTCTKIK
ncbi:hypothetical protein B0H13DRAFT_1676392 [Mycena leptocephala]|nr:hypothetical protein B0H13DRAFT_1676392 [Mycena leptocephala]